jgi:hypothetical protein
MDWSRTYRQPDRFSCGGAVLVVARMVNDPAYAELVRTGRHPGTGFALPGSTVERRFGDEVLAMHRRTTGPVDVTGALQLPWPPGLGTPPWAVARQMSGASGVPGARYDARVVSPFDRRAGLDSIVTATAAGHAVPLYVGTRWTPRHVVLVLGEDLRTYDPSVGRRVRMEPDDFVRGRLEIAGWSRPWFSVLPV